MNWTTYLPWQLHRKQLVSTSMSKSKTASDDSNEDTSDTDCDPELLYADSTTIMESFSEK